MPVALVVSHPANMPGYNSTVDLEEVQSLSRYCFFSISNSRTFISSVHVAQKSCLFILLALLFFFCDYTRILRTIRTISPQDIELATYPDYNGISADTKRGQYLPEPGKEQIT